MCTYSRNKRKICEWLKIAGGHAVLSIPGQSRIFARTVGDFLGPSMRSAWSLDADLGV